MNQAMFAVIACLLAACDGAQEPAPDSGDVASDGTASSEISDVAASGTPAQGSASAETGGAGGSARAIAYGVAHYPGARVLGVSPDYLLKGGKNPMWFQYETSDEPAAVLAFYKGEAEKAGYAVKSEKSREIWREISLKTVRPGEGVLNVNTLGKKGEPLLINVHISEDN